MFNSIFNFLGKLVGKIELLIHHPIYPIKSYISKVSDDLYRSSFPTDDMCVGFKTVVNLCIERKERHEDINNLWIPIVDNTTPLHAQVLIFLALFQDKARMPVLVHCEMGIGRTGIMCACYRIVIQGWSNTDALNEAMSYGLKLPCQMDFIRNFKL